MAERFYTTEQLSEHIHRTPDGFLLCEGVPINRTGEMIYKKSEAVLMPWLNEYEADEDGNVRIIREPEDVFRPETLTSFEGKPITIDHPSGLVGPDTWAGYAKGNMQNIRRGDGDQADLTLADVLVTTEDAIELILSGLREVSCGYDADYVQIGPGLLKQIGIVGNHLAVVDKGRAGSRCAIQDQDSNQEVSGMKFKERLKKVFTAWNAPASVMATLDAMSEEDDEKEKKKTDDAEAEYVCKKDLQETVDKCMDAWYKKTKDAESEEEEKEKKKKKNDEEEEKEKETKDAWPVGLTRDAAIQDLAARSEILVTGITLPSFTADSKPADLVAAKRSVLAKAYATEDGKKAIEKFTGANPSFDALPQATLDAAFIGASELIGQANNGRFARSKISKDDFGAAGSISAINKANREFWDKRKPTV